jgi:hypothetical protein
MVTCGGPPRLQRRAVALQESKLLRWSWRGADLLLRLDGYVHVSLGAPGQDQGTAWSQELELLLRNARVLEEPRELPLWISEGALDKDSALLLLLPVPFEERGSMLLKLAGAEGALVASGDGLGVSAVSEPRFIERVG